MRKLRRLKGFLGNMGSDIRKDFKKTPQKRKNGFGTREKNPVGHADAQMIWKSAETEREKKTARRRRAYQAAG